jgi:hypothetical protein
MCLRSTPKGQCCRSCYTENMTVLDERVIVPPEANPGHPLKGDFERMARKRFQHGQLILRGGRHPVWVGRWREDVIRDGKIKRVHMCETRGTKTDAFSLTSRAWSIAS